MFGATPNSMVQQQHQPAVPPDPAFRAQHAGTRLAVALRHKRSHKESDIAAPQGMRFIRLCKQHPDSKASMLDLGRSCVMQATISLGHACVGCITAHLLPLRDITSSSNGAKLGTKAPNKPSA